MSASSLAEIINLPAVHNALLAGALLAPLAGMMGTFVVLRGLSFFGEAIAHATFAGVGIAIFLGLSPQLDPAGFLGVLVGFSLCGAFFIHELMMRSRLKGDTSIAIVFAAMVSTGMLILSMSRVANPARLMVNVMFGSILVLDRHDLQALGLLLALMLVFLWRVHRQMILLTVQQDYATAIGVRTRLLSLAFLFLLTMTISLGVRMVGTLLISALLVVPAAAARNVARGFFQMLALAVIAAFLSIEIGVVVSGTRDLPAGPTIVLVAIILFLGSLAWSAIRRRQRLGAAHG